MENMRQADDRSAPVTRPDVAMQPILGIAVCITMTAPTCSLVIDAVSLCPRSIFKRSFATSATSFACGNVACSRSAPKPGSASRPPHDADPGSG